ncbi:6-carboxytetrahydropterin synthase QueD [Candidatus Sumerlaeota bacterium]|nr:6-carboxytetrahydropterin synthase QueD [Candidatus Sumerlaeota bacterium]
MHEINYRFKFSAAHFLRDYEGICRNTHGHNWEVIVTLEGEELTSNGMLIDFYEVERVVKPVRDDLDHAFLNEIPPFTEISPTSENLAKWIFDRIRPQIESDRVRLRQISVREYEDSLVTYRPS